MDKLLIYFAISFLLKTIFSYLYPKIDVKLYKENFEDKISKGISCGKFLDWLFTIKRIGGFEGALPYYRIFQKTILITFWGLSYLFFYKQFSLWIFIIDFVIGILFGAYYWMVYERKYYKLGRQEYLLIEMHLNNNNPYWLKRIWFSGYWLFKSNGQDNGFRLWKFDMSFVIGLAIMYITSAVFLFINLY